MLLISYYDFLIFHRSILSQTAVLGTALQNLLNRATRRPGFLQARLNPLSDFEDFRSHRLLQTKLFFINITAEVTLAQYRTTFIRVTALSVNLKMLHEVGYS